MRRRPKRLFCRKSLTDVLSRRAELLSDEVDGFGRDYLLNTPTEDLTDYLEEKYTLQAPRLKTDDKYIAEHGEADIDVSQDRMRHIRDRSTPTYLKGRFMEVAIPFSGDGDLFQYRASTYSTLPPSGRIQGSEVHLRYESLDHDADALQKKIDGAIQKLQKHLKWTRQDLSSFNNRLRSRAKQAVQHRKDRLQKDEGLVADLGIPIKRRQDAPKTYAAPVVRKKPSIKKPPATENLFDGSPS